MHTSVQNFEREKATLTEEIATKTARHTYVSTQIERKSSQIAVHRERERELLMELAKESKRLSPPSAPSPHLNSVSSGRVSRDRYQEA
eukprot:4332434-Prorocentrum_lima.AAC.1